jgi:hypothetical protein
MTRKMHKENVLGFKHSYKCEEMHRRWILSIPKWGSLWKLEFWSVWNIWIKSVGSKKGPNCAPNTTLERSLEQESSFECTCSKDLFNYIYISGAKLDHFYYLHFGPKHSRHSKTLIPKVIPIWECLGLTSFAVSHTCGSVFESQDIFLTHFCYHELLALVMAHFHLEVS